MSRVFVALPRMRDPSLHAAYNAWHQLDHLPQNQALDGVQHGQRWVRPPDLRSGDRTPPGSPLAAVDYFAMYWFREPVETSVREWLRLGNSTLEEGRRPDLQWTDRPLVGFFEPLRGYVAAHEPFTPDALPHYPSAEVGLRLVRLAEPHSPGSAAWYEWEHQHRLSRLAKSPDVVGSWTFTSLRVDLAGTAAPLPKRGLHLSVTYRRGARGVPLGDLDPEPLGDGDELLLDTGFRAISPGKWDWFDGRY
jgi:hypothetical protein